LLELLSMRVMIGVCLVSAFICPPARADSNVQQWLTMTGDVRIDAKDNAYAVFVRRSAPDALKIAQRLVQLGWRHRIGRKASLIAYAVHVTTYRDSAPNRTEVRFGQGVSVPGGRIGGGQLEGRVVIEEVMARGSDDIGVRGRPRVRWTHPLSLGGKVDLQLSDEAIFALNSTDAGQRAGLTANRASAGVRFALCKHFGVQPSYTWQHVNRIAAADREDHIVGLTLDAAF
jgi:hypothetical protein